MIGLAIVVALFGGIAAARLHRKSAVYRQRASQCAEMAAFYGSGSLGTLQNGKRFAEEPGLTPEQRVKILHEWSVRAEAEMKVGARFSELEKAYLRAARRPWEAGPPDPFAEFGIPAHQWP